jgi:Flp pilus assembly protein TadB
MVVVLRVLMHLHASWWVYAVIVAAGICWYVVGMGDGRLAEREEQFKRQTESHAEENTGV